MAVKVITPATQQIPTADLRLHSRASSANNTEDPLFVTWLAGAVHLAEHYTGRSIGAQTLELALDEFPVGAIELLQGPVASITSIKYIDDAGVEQTLSNTLYTLDNYNDIEHWAIPAYNTTWPTTRAVANAVKVRYVAGDLPPAVKSALLLAVAHYSENREATSNSDLKELPIGSKDLLNTVKDWSYP